jgi:hypothetical protein
MFPSGRFGVAPIHLLIGILAAIAAAMWPLTPALSSAEAMTIRVGCAVLAISASLAIAFSSGKGRPIVWTISAVTSGAIALLLLWQHIDAGATCIGNYNGQPIVIGREFSEQGAAVARENPGPISELLLVVGGQTELVWTASSISSCRLWLGWGGMLLLPLLAVSLSSLVAARGSAWRWTKSIRQTSAAGEPGVEVRYDAFISYRRLDRERAESLVEELESHGFRIAIDFRDFRPNEQVITEMERCIRESRFVLCVITEQYASSGFTTEEASVARLLDLIERRNRVVPLIFDKVPMPAWLQGLVGIDFGPQAQADPIERLVALLSRDRQGSRS